VGEVGAGRWDRETAAHKEYFFKHRGHRILGQNPENSGLLAKELVVKGLLWFCSVFLWFGHPSPEVVSGAGADVYLFAGVRIS
jgi:hypothetical protein